MPTELLAGVIATIGGLLGVIIGAIIAWWLPARMAKTQRAREIEAEVTTAASICLGRLLKMQIALRQGKEAIFGDEKHHFGADSDRFLRAISRRPTLSHEEYMMFERMSEILMEVVPQAEMPSYIDQLSKDLRAKVVDAG